MMDTNSFSNTEVWRLKPRSSTYIDFYNRGKRIKLGNRDLMTVKVISLLL